MSNGMTAASFRLIDLVGTCGILLQEICGDSPDRTSSDLVGDAVARMMMAFWLHTDLLFADM